MLNAMLEAMKCIYTAGIEQGDLDSRFSADFLAEISVAVLNNSMCLWAHDKDYPLKERLLTIPDFVLAATR